MNINEYRATVIATIECEACAAPVGSPCHPINDSVARGTYVHYTHDERSLAFLMRGLQTLLFDECETAGWDPAKANTFGDEIGHIHEEVSEAFRAVRQYHDFATHYRASDGKPEGVPPEFADVVIGLAYNAELHGFSLLEAVFEKHDYNLRRSYEAEGRRLHP